MTRILVAPRHNIKAFGGEGSVEDYLTPFQCSTLSDALKAEYTSDAALVQYLIYNNDGSLSEQSLRLKTGSEGLLEWMHVKMHRLILDWDFPKQEDQKVKWGDPAKDFDVKDVVKFVQGHPILASCSAFYFSKHGVRIVFTLSEPLSMNSTEDKWRWKKFYNDFIESIKADAESAFEGSTIDKRSDPYCLNRVPNYEDVKSVGIFINHSNPTVDSTGTQSYQEPEPSAKKENTFKPLDEEKAKGALWNHPLITHLREEQVSLSYNDWRSLGTNIASLIPCPQEAFKLFDEISSWDKKGYDPSAVQSHWGSILQSKDQYGPVTYFHFNLNLKAILPNVDVSTSLAAQVRKAVLRGDGTVKSDDNYAEVYALLYKKQKVKGDEIIEVPLTNLSNLKIILTVDNRWKECFWRNHLGQRDFFKDSLVEDELVTEMREAIGRVYLLNYSKDNMLDVIKWICKDNEKNPVASYLRDLTWDGVDRTHVLAQALGQKVTDPFTLAVLKRFMISAVVRPLEWDNPNPNTNWKVDTVLILKGGQGRKKSTFFKSLCRDVSWFSDSLPSIEKANKDASLHMLGKWFVEQAEFEGHVARSSVENMKAFITREREEFRKPYARTETWMRRPSLLVGTTNSEAFLNDNTGDRRFWVLEIPETHIIDIGIVKKERDQLWAQAVHNYKQGEQWWLSDAEAQLNDTNNSLFRRQEPLNEAILEFLLTNPKMFGMKASPEYDADLGFSLKTLIEEGLDKKLIDIKSSMSIKIQDFLRKQGWEKTRARVYNGNHNYQRLTIFRKVKGVTP